MKSRKRAASPSAHTPESKRFESEHTSGVAKGVESKSPRPDDSVGEEPTSLPSKGKLFAGRKLSDIYVLEVFAGTARLTKSFKRKGFRALAFDQTSKRSEGQDILEFDLSKKEEVDSLLSFIKDHHDRVALVHLAPPCGTASRARGKRLRFLQFWESKSLDL